MCLGPSEAILTTTTMASASQLSPPTSIMAYVRLIRRRWRTAILFSTFPVIGYIRRAARGTSQVRFLCRYPVFCLDIFSFTASASFRKRFYILLFSGKLFSTLCLVNWATWTVRTEGVITLVATASTNLVVDTYVGTACFTTGEKTALWKTLTTALFTTVRITGISFVFGRDSVAQSASSKNQTRLSPTIFGVRPTCLRTVLFNLVSKAEFVGRVLETRSASHTGWSAIAVHKSPRSALGSG